MGLGLILPIAAIIATVLLVILTDAHPGTKIAAVAVCMATFLVPRFIPATGWLAGPVQAILGILIVLYLKFKGYTR